VPELGLKEVELKVKLPTPKTDKGPGLVGGLRALFKNQELCDVELVCAEVVIPAHKAVLAAQSPVFKQGLQAEEHGAGRQQIRLADVANPEAVRLMLNHVYEMSDDDWQHYNPGTQEINKDVLRLAKNFQLPGLADRAMHWRSKDLTTGNVVERLTICEEFGLQTLSDKIISQLAMNKKALFEVSNGPQIMSYPKLMQALLQHTAGVPEEKIVESKQKKPRKA
jgi:hypothetical protein